MNHRKLESRPTVVVLGFLLIFACAGTVRAQTTSFTYQGRLTDGGTPATGSYDLQFALWDSNSGGTQIGVTQTVNLVAVSGGIFTVTLDFGVSAFPGANRFLEISVRPAGGGSFTVLSPRQQISSTPYAIRTLSAATADTASTATNATQLGGVAASQYALTNDSRLSDSRPPIAGSSNYIQNTTSPQASSNFNISGNGTTAGTLNGNVVNATTQYNINGNRMLSASGTNNLFAGVGAGQANTSGNSNVFLGPGAGQANTIGARNSFFGLNAGRNNVGDAFGNGSDNSFFGNGAGTSNTGQQNSFFGVGAGAANTSGNFNSFFGEAAGTGNTGSNNSFFGSNAGVNNITDGNSFFGFRAGFANTNGFGNAFFGYQTGQSSTGNGHNSLFGYGAGANMTCCSDNSFFGFQAGLNANNDNNSFFGSLAGSNTTNSANSFFGTGSGQNNTDGSRNSFFGYHAGFSNLTGNSNTLIGYGADAPGNNLQLATAIGANAAVRCSHCMVLGDASDSNLIVGIGTTDPSPYASKLVVEGGDRNGVVGRSGGGVGVWGTSDSNYGVYGFSASSYAGYFNGKIHVASVPFGSGTPVLVTPGGDIVAQGSSLRFKTNVHPFVGGLDIVRRLRPINFNWKQDGQPDIGLGAEDVAKVAPSFTFTDSKGEITGVKYDRLNILLINAVKEQQAQIETLRAQNAALSARLLGVEKALRKKAGSFRRRR